MAHIEDVEEELDLAQERIRDLESQLAEETTKVSNVRGALQDLALEIQDALQALDR